jgi:alkylation response protein AidB-like acyl-CoA dehydrogenase
MPMDTLTPAPLTVLTEDETLFRDAVREFAEGEIRPRAAAMERAAQHDPALIRSLFELGVMAVDVPEA